MKRSLENLKRFGRDERGIEVIEYAVMTAIIVGGLVTAMALLAGVITNRFGETQKVVSGGG